MTIDSITLQSTIWPSDFIATGNEWFGYSCEIDGEYAIVGCPKKMTGTNRYGAAYIYYRNPATGIWEEQQKIEAGIQQHNSYFGVAVAISGDTVVVGAHYDNTDSKSGGKAYVFTRTGTVWTQQAALAGSSIVATNQFGTEVGISGNTIIVGAPYDDDTATNSGTAWIFTRTAGVWTQQQKLQASDAAASQYFGGDVAIDGNYCVISAGQALAKEKAYVFTNIAGTWTEQQILTGDQGAGAEFGGAVDISGDKVTVGAVQEDETFASSGAVYVFIRSGVVWTKQQRIPIPLAYDDFNYKRFGHSVALNGNFLAVGATRDNDLPDTTAFGATYIFELRTGIWTFVDRLFPGTEAQTGWSVEINESSKTIIVGGIDENVLPAATGEGVARFYDIELASYPAIQTENISYHRFEVPDLQIVKTLTPVNQWNEFDDHGNMVSLPRLRGEKNWEYKRRIHDVFVNIANSSYRGLINGITRELGLTLYNAIEINPKVSGGEFLASDPYIKFDGVYLYLYSDYSNDLLDYQIDRYEPGGNYEHLGRLVDLINTTSFFEASLINDTDPYTRSMTILNQSNRGSIHFERIPVSNRFKLGNTHIVQGSVYFSNRNTFRTEVSTLTAVNEIGKYYIDYSKGIVTVYTVPTSEDIVRYQYIKYPLRAVASPVILHDINDDNFKVKMFEQVLLDDGTYTHGMPTEIGLDIINELFSVVPMYWGV